MPGSDLPLRALAVFEAAARLRSFRAAAEELNLTPSAVSHQIRFLERRLGVTLFERAGRGVVLSQEGSDFHGDIRDSFRKLRHATEAATRRGRVEIVRIQTPPSLASQWLLPRLPAFLAAHPAIDIRVTAEMGRGVQGHDLAIVYGPAEDWAAQGAPFLRERLEPLCAPALAMGVAVPADLLPLTLIRSRGNRLSWDAWFQRWGVDSAGARSIQFDPSHVAIDAAVKGLGVILESDLLTGDDVAAGRLVRPLPDFGVTALSYWLIISGAAARESVDRVRAWLLESAMPGL